ncbi:MAG: hypothetical protein JW819_03020 [Candidatus Krumholzibacteriota bacterium]|nr:hypothetical protein [Candidatus Krumholzibacteriota bacterium]
MFESSAKSRRQAALLLGGLLLAGAAGRAPAAPPAAPADSLVRPVPAQASLRLPRAAAPAAGPVFFYHGRPYGSEALINPVQLVLNGGYGITQLDNRSNDPFNVDYRLGWRNVRRNLAHPIRAIEEEGWGSFLKKEILPFSTNTQDARYWPNYTQHLIGGGMSYRVQVEWFRHHGIACPRLWAAGTIAAYHLVNEVVENDDYAGWTTDPVADLYLFDPLSMLLFSSDGVCRFFSEKLHLQDWSYQPAWDPRRETLENNGQNFSMKLGLPGSERWSLFYHFGTHGEGGLSRTWPGGDCFSFAGGFKAKELVDLAQGQRTVDLAVTAGLFWDRRGSLLASLQYAGTKDYRLRLNVYPGVFRLGPVSPGIFLALDDRSRMLVGVNLNLLPLVPVGLAAGSD